MLKNKKSTFMSMKIEKVILTLFDCWVKLAN